MQRRLDLAWNLVRCVHVGRQELVRELMDRDHVRIFPSGRDGT